MKRYSFAEHYIRKQSEEIVEHCVRNGISLQPVVDMIESFYNKKGYSNAAKLEGVFQNIGTGIANAATGAKNFLGNAAMGAAKGAGAVLGAVGSGAQTMGNNFMQGWNMTQPGAQNTAAGGMPAGAAGATQQAGAANQAGTANQSQQSQQQVQQQVVSMGQMLKTMGANMQQMYKAYNQLSKLTGQTK